MTLKRSLDLLNAEMRVRGELLQQLEQQQLLKHEMEERIRAVTAELTDLTSCLAPVCCPATPTLAHVRRHDTFRMFSLPVLP